MGGLFGTRKPLLALECGSCGRGAPSGATSCPHCGVQLEEDIAKCSHCASWIPADAAKCPKCQTEFLESRSEWGLKRGDRRIMLPRILSVEDLEMKVKERSAPTLIPALKDPILKEVTTYPIVSPFTYARVVRNTVLAELVYQLLEPQLFPTDKEVLDEVRSTLHARKRPAWAADLRGPTKEEAIEAVNAAMERRHIRDLPVTRDRAAYYLSRDLAGFGAIDALMADPDVSRITCNGAGIPLSIDHRVFRAIKTDVSFKDAGALADCVRRLLRALASPQVVVGPVKGAVVEGGWLLDVTPAPSGDPRGAEFELARHGFAAVVGTAPESPTAGKD